jgi:hypothetical protein
LDELALDKKSLEESALDEHSVPIKRQGTEGSLRLQGTQDLPWLKRTQGWFSLKRPG